MTALPSISVIIAATDSARAVEDCLRSLPPSDQVEVLVVAPRDRILPVPSAPGIRWIAVEPGCGVPRLRRLGLERASAPVVAFTEDSCRLGRGWWGSWLDAFLDPTVLAATGAVEQVEGGSLVDWAVFFCEYAPFLRLAGELRIAGTPGGDLRRSSGPVGAPCDARLAGNNFAVRRDWLLDAIGEADGVHEHALPALVAGRSGKVARVVRAVAWHARRYSAREALGDRFRFGLDFGRMRAVSEPGHRRIAAAVLGPAILLIQLARLVATMLRKRRYLIRFAATFPLTTAMLTSWSAGEWLGWILGPRRGRARRPSGRRCGTGARSVGPSTGPQASPRTDYTASPGPL